MGISSSTCEYKNVATTKLILEDGRLQEFSYPVKVSYILHNIPSCFICDSDEMGFDDVVSAVSDDEELHLGQLYFALPLSLLKRRLKAEEMAALAVKASTALSTNSGGENCLNFSEFTGESGGRKQSRKAVDGGNIVGRRRRSGCGGRRGKYTARLSAIQE